MRIVGGAQAMRASWWAHGLAGSHATKLHAPFPGPLLLVFVRESKPKSHCSAPSTTPLPQREVLVRQPKTFKRRALRPVSSLPHESSSGVPAGCPPMIRPSIGSFTNAPPATVCTNEPNGTPTKSSSVANREPLHRKPAEPTDSLNIGAANPLYHVPTAKDAEEQLLAASSTSERAPHINGS